MDSFPNRIVSVSKPYVRPIVRGKEVKKVEFGAKCNNILVDGMSFFKEARLAGHYIVDPQKANSLMLCGYAHEGIGFLRVDYIMSMSLAQWGSLTLNVILSTK